MTETTIKKHVSGATSGAYIKNDIGIELFYRVWEPTEIPKAHLVFVHGHGEHISRYIDVFDQFSKVGIKVLAFDQVGCGETGRRANDIGGAMGLKRVLLDISLMIEQIYRPDIPLFLMGHSFGGAAILNYLERGSMRELLYGAIASAPCIEVYKDSIPPNIVKHSLTFLASYFPRLKVSVGVDISLLSRKKSVIELYKKDPFVFSKCALVQLQDVLTGCQNLLKEGYKKICVPRLLLAHGTGDRITSYEATYSLATKLEGTGNIKHLEMKTYHGFYHELHFEPESDEVLANYIKWIFDQLPKDSSLQPTTK
ncbi:hypothetical protein DSO57_1018069 [Entomophthora muscae]|uniref:Uncharacterized protein n=2 Tax=Entomophthora muscae TaxID=34485 RepID=A0ACC2S6V2_9FUNG|nr:hypothetical protein DSO57_1018069 [Entomophthora muscae]